VEQEADGGDGFKQGGNTYAYNIQKGLVDNQPFVIEILLSALRESLRQ